MFQIWYEYQSVSYPKFRCFKIRKDQSIQDFVFHKPLKDILRYTAKYPKYHHIFMLDEGSFSFGRFDIFEHFDEKFTIQDLQKLIRYQCDTKKKQHWLEWEKIASYFDNIYVDGEEKKFLVGEKGDIFFRLYLIYLQKTMCNTFNSIYGDVLNTQNITILPQSFHTMMFLRDNLKKENFLLLYISDNNCKILKIEHGFYHSVDTLNLGINSLKQMYKDNDIRNYRSKGYDEIENNALARWLVKKTLEFYVQLLCKWIYEKNVIGTDVIVVSPIVKNSHFTEVFNEEYLKYTNNYIVPFHHSEQLHNFGRTREPDMMDALVLINRDKSILRVLNGSDE